jgi:hypothetical protein
MNRVSSIVKYNNWEKLEDNITLINEKNYLSNIISSIKYRSKECFDIMIKHPKTKTYLNKISYRIYKLFETYSNAPNAVNEYYLDKILENLAYINIYTIREASNNDKLFLKIFNKVEKSEYFFKIVFEKVCKVYNINNFMIAYNYLVSNKSQYNWFNTEWFNENILFQILINDSIEILNYLDSLNVNIFTSVYHGTQISSYVIALYGICKNRWYRTLNYKFSSQCFEYLINKQMPGPNTNNFLWAVMLVEMDYTFNIDDFMDYKEYFKLEIDWDHNYDEIFNTNQPQINIEINMDEINNMFSNDNLIQKFNNYNHENDYSSTFIYSEFVILMDYLYSLTKNNSNLKTLVNGFIQQLNNDFYKNACKNLYNLTDIITSCSTKNRRTRYRNYTRRSRTIKEKFNLLIKGIKLIQTLRKDKIINFNPIDSSLFEINKKNKPLVKKIILLLANLETEYINSKDFEKVKTQIFNKKEIKEWNKIIKEFNSDSLKIEMKKYIGNKTNKAVKKNKIPIVPGINGENDPELNIESDSESVSSNDNDNVDEIEV